MSLIFAPRSLREIEELVGMVPFKDVEAGTGTISFTSRSCLRSLETGRRFRWSSPKEGLEAIAMRGERGIRGEPSQEKRVLWLSE